MTGNTLRLLVVAAVLDTTECRRLLQNVPLAGISSLRPLHITSLSPPSAASLAEGEANIKAETAIDSSYSPGAGEDGAEHANSSTAATNGPSSSSSSMSAAYAVEPVLFNSSAVVEDPESTNTSVSTNTSAITQELVETLEVDQQVTVVGEVLLGQLLCDTLVDAEGAPFLQIAISANETLLVNQTSYATVSGGSFTDGVGRRTWTGVVVDPPLAEDEFMPRSVSMTWGEFCDVETFSLKVTKYDINGNTTLVKSVPCGLPGLHTCVVEVALDFLPDDQALRVDLTNLGDSAAGRKLGTPASSNDGRTSIRRRMPGPLSPVRRSGVRKLQYTTMVEVQAMVLYSDQALDLMGVSDRQMESLVFDSFSSTNLGFANSEIGVNLTIVYQGRLPYDEGDSSSATKLEYLRLDSGIKSLRDEYGADTVLLVGDLNDVCGLAYFLPDTLPTYSEYAYGAVNPNCFENLVVAHELGHNLGCEHNREHSSTEMEYAHGYRYCTGITFTTIMSYTAGCSATRANYFSNPDVSYQGRPTGTATEDCARAIEENKEIVANFRDKIADAQGDGSGNEGGANGSGDDDSDPSSNARRSRESGVFGAACFFSIMVLFRSIFVPTL